MIQLRVYGEDRLGDIARSLRRADGTLRRDLTQGVRRAADPAVRAVKAAIVTADVSGRRTGARKRFTAHVAAPPLRARIARAVEVDISTSSAGPRVVFRLREGSIPMRVRPLVKYIAGGSTRWRHPIMGRRSRWASQNAPNVWWKTLRPQLARFRREVDQALERTADAIEARS